MAKKRKLSIRVGSIVRLNRRVFPIGKREKADVLELFDEGAARLSEYLDGFRCWNVADLERVPKR